MTEKRYFKRMWGEEYYIFDSQTISEKEFDEKVQYEEYRAFADSMNGEDVVNRLNELNDENKTLKQELKVYREIAQCSNCHYHDYDEFNNSDGSYDEYEVCRKGNDIDNRICSEWREL